MTEDPPLTRPTTCVWKYALLGGLLAAALTVGAYSLAGDGEQFPLLIVAVGGLLAGSLAHQAPTRAGLGAGVIGGLPALGWILPAMQSTASDFGSAWSVEAVEPLLLSIFVVTLLAVTGLLGLVGGLFGGWLGRTLAN